MVSKGKEQEQGGPCGEMPPSMDFEIHVLKVAVFFRWAKSRRKESIRFLHAYANGSLHGEGPPLSTEGMIG